MKQEHTASDPDSIFDLDEGPWALDAVTGFWTTMDGRVAREAYVTPPKTTIRWGKPYVGDRYMKPVWVKPHIGNHGYPRLSSPAGKQYVHRVVARAWLPPDEGRLCVNHKDFNKENNNVENLEWVTHAENSQHYFQNK